MSSEDPAKRFVVWDSPTRVFHWCLVLAVLLCWISAEEDYLQVHQYAGYTVLVLVLTRVVWGVIGSVHSRFSDFLVSPLHVLAYLRGRLPSRPRHNPAGGYSVLVMLALLLLQALTGLFNSDGLMFDGPFYHALESRWTDKLGEIHATAFWVLLGFIGLHVASILYYQVLRRQDLLTPMLLGGLGGRAAPRPAWLALLVLLVCVGGLAVAIYYAPEPPPNMWGM